MWLRGGRAGTGAAAGRRSSPSGRSCRRRHGWSGSRFCGRQGAQDAGCGCSRSRQPLASGWLEGSYWRLRCCCGVSPHAPASLPWCRWQRGCCRSVQQLVQSIVTSVGALQKLAKNDRVPAVICASASGRGSTARTRSADKWASYRCGFRRETLARVRRASATGSDGGRLTRSARSTRKVCGGRRAGTAVLLFRFDTLGPAAADGDERSWKPAHVAVVRGLRHVVSASPERTRPRRRPR